MIQLAFLAVCTAWDLMSFCPSVWPQFVSVLNTKQCAHRLRSGLQVQGLGNVTNQLISVQQSAAAAHFSPEVSGGCMSTLHILDAYSAASAEQARSDAPHFKSLRFSMQMCASKN